MLSCLLYGCSIESGSALAGNPLLAIDPPGSGNGSLGSLLLSLAQGTARNRALAMFTSTFDAEEISKWTFQVECRREFQEDYFLESEHFVEVIRFRSRILSGIFRLMARKVVPRLDERRVLVLDKLSKHHPGHPRNQLDPFLALVTVILQALLGSLHGSSDRGEYEAWRLMSGWIEEQQ